MDSFNIATDPCAPPFFDILLGFPSASTCQKWHLSPYTHPFLTCNSDKREDARIYMTDFHRFWIGLECHSYLSSFPFYSPRGQGVMTETACAFQWKHSPTFLSTQDLFPFWTLGDWSPFHNIAPDSEVLEFSSSDPYEVLQLSSIVNNSASHCFEQILDRTKQTQSEAEQNSVILTCSILPGSYLRAFHSLITVHDPIWRRNLEHRRSVSLQRTNLSPCTASYAPVARKYSKIVYAICLPRENRSHF